MPMTKLKQTYRSMSTPCLSLASMASAQVLVKSWTSQNQAEEDGEFAVQTETTFCKPGEEREAFFPILSQRTRIFDLWSRTGKYHAASTQKQIWDNGHDHHTTTAEAAMRMLNHNHESWLKSLTGPKSPWPPTTVVIATKFKRLPYIAPLYLPCAQR